MLHASKKMLEKVLIAFAKLYTSGHHRMAGSKVQQQL
jgi:hypothetical protein